MVMCERDVAFWVSEFCSTYDPREVPADMPFTLFDKQAEFLRWLSQREAGSEDGIAEKCRDVGFTWLCCAYAVHGWLFRTGFRCGFGSRKLELVDKVGDPACIFEKMRFLIDHLPVWMLPSDYTTGYCKILNKDNGASISGEGGDEIGRGDRTSIYFVDEAAFLERSQRVDAALSQTSRCKIWVSTPNGQGNTFYRKRFSGQFAVFTFNWQDDPRKGPEWYERQKMLLDPVTLAQEVDIDYSASIEGICIPARWVKDAVDLVERVPELPQNGPLYAAYDVAAEGGDKNVLGFRRGVVVSNDVISWGNQNTTLSAHKVRDECERRKVDDLKYDAGGGYGEPIAQLGRDGVPFHIRGLNGGEGASDNIWPDGRMAKEKFINGRAEWWWILRERFRKTSEYVAWLNGAEGGIEHPLDELISIPNEQDVIRDLSLPLIETADGGKVRLEGKQKMKARGVKSPDFADMLAYLFAPDEPSHIVENAFRVF